MAERLILGRRSQAMESLSERAYESIRDNILRGRYALGAALSRRQLAKELRMSFLPVSEAVRRLEIDGLLESKPRAGTRVRIPTRQDILERYALREALETQAARLCAEHADENGWPDLLKIGSHLDQFYGSGTDGDEEFLYSVHTYHMHFHLRIAELAGNSLLRGAIEREQVLVFQLALRYGRAAAEPSTAVSQRTCGGGDRDGGGRGLHDARAYPTWHAAGYGEYGPVHRRKWMEAAPENPGARSEGRTAVITGRSAVLPS
jgi:DNA-binding GntR family transcriptional regulator